MDGCLSSSYLLVRRRGSVLQPRKNYVAIFSRAAGIVQPVTKREIV